MLASAIITPPSPPALRFSVETPSSPSDCRRPQFRPATIRSSATAYREKSKVCFAPSQMASSASSLYDILGISIGATSQDIKSAYRKLARTCHPDVAAIERKDCSVDDFIRIHAAYTTLSDPEKRAVYDRKLVFRRMRPLTTAGLSGYGGGRNWETDQCW